MQKPNPVWFKAKDYGYGWYPATWQGWLLLGIYLLVTIAWVIFCAILFPENEVAFLVVFLAGDVLLTGSLIYICFKTGEPTKWRWGKK